MVRRQSGPKLDVWTTDRGPAWFAPTPLTTRLTCSNMSRQNTSKPKAIIAHSVRSFAQILSPWRTTNHAVPTKVHELLFELLLEWILHHIFITATSCIHSALVRSLEFNLLCFSNNNCTLCARQRICGQLNSMQTGDEFWHKAVVLQRVPLQPPQAWCHEETCWRPAYGDTVQLLYLS